MRLRTAQLLLAGLALAGCGDGESPHESAPASPESSVENIVRFDDAAEAMGIDFVSVAGNTDKSHLLESTGSGVAIADYDGDGDLDLYLATAQTSDDWLAGRRPHRNALYRNEGDGTFTDVAAGAGVDLAAWSAGVYFADVDEDGDKDLFVTTWGPNVLYRNDGDGTFTDVTAAAGVAGPADAWSASAAFFDADLDGDLDLYVANYADYDLAAPPYDGTTVPWKGIDVYRGPLGFVAQVDRFYLNDGRGRFTDVTESSGIGSAAPQYSLGVVPFDADDDGDPEIYVANDSCPNYLWRNNGDGRFVEIGSVAGVATNEDARAQAGMGTDAGDVNGDGRLDLVVTNFSHDWNTLYGNVGGLTFNDDTFRAGLRDAYLPLAWGTKFFDADNDGHLDLYVANGHIYDEVDDHPQLNTTYKQQDLLYLNNGDGTLRNVVAEAGPGLQIVESTRGLAVADLDMDGDLDLVLTQADAKASVLINDGGNAGNWISVTLVGSESNRDAVGARLTLTAGGRTHVREVNPNGSYQSQSQHAVHFGLGSASGIERLEIRWPSGATSVEEGLQVNRFVTVEEGQGVVETREP